ncbi:MAG TPA: type II toxin-antitoxin system VapC family toxin [Planctomycetota bacterium]|nr:type II toxin-antitoxin system VapC family toxin [Planctomycetota bacterium]
MYVLDTDLFSILDHTGTLSEKVRGHMMLAGIDNVCTSIITYEEQTRGWLSYIGRAKSPADEINAYRLLSKHIETYRYVRVLSFDQHASWHFQRLQKAGIRIGSMDLKIAAIALAQDATLITRNLRHFRDVPGLKIADWTK